jgi:hypothetical protein
MFARSKRFAPCLRANQFKPQAGQCGASPALPVIPAFTKEVTMHLKPTKNVLVILKYDPSHNGGRERRIGSVRLDASAQDIPLEIVEALTPPELRKLQALLNERHQRLRRTVVESALTTVQDCRDVIMAARDDAAFIALVEQALKRLRKHLAAARATNDAAAGPDAQNAAAGAAWSQAEPDVPAPAVQRTRASDVHGVVTPNEDARREDAVPAAGHTPPCTARPAEAASANDVNATRTPAEPRASEARDNVVPIAEALPQPMHFHVTPAAADDVLNAAPNEAATLAAVQPLLPSDKAAHSPAVIQDSVDWAVFDTVAAVARQGADDQEGHATRDDEPAALQVGWPLPAQSATHHLETSGGAVAGEAPPVDRPPMWPTAPATECAAATLNVNSEPAAVELPWFDGGHEQTPEALGAFEAALPESAFQRAGHRSLVRGDAHSPAQAFAEQNPTRNREDPERGI